jgi:hypothetical protein
LKFLAPFIFLHVGPLFDKILCLRAYFYLQIAGKNLYIAEKSPDSHDLLTSFQIKVAKGEKSATIIESTLEVFNRSEFVKKSQHDFICALLRYIFDKHLLPHLLLGAHLIHIYVLGTPRGLTVILPP